VSRRAEGEKVPIQKVQEVAARRFVPAALLVVALAHGLSASPAPRRGGEADLDAFMARVLERRDESWRRLHDYILSERESFRLLGPGDIPLHGLRREYSWYVREGYLVRSPIRFDGVTLNEEERRAYEEKWLREEREREQRAREREQKGGKTERTETEVRLSPGGVKVTKRQKTEGGEQELDPAAKQDDESPLQDFVDPRGEPRFVSEAYFLRFKFEPGNYYLAGREKLDGRDVLRIEYYPSRLFGPDDEKEGGEPGPESRGERDQQSRRRGGSRGRDPERDIERQLNKVSLVTLWVDPAEHQIVRYTFENVDFGFLPGRWLVRADEARASMAMARVLDGVWLPSRITMAASLSLASGGYRFSYEREFFDYKKAEVGARIRSYVPKEP
jgi:hypothetical protein